MSQSFYITTPIYYVNAEPHLGHAYTTILADAAARFHRLMGQTVRFQTGTDEHGDKIAEAAAKEGIEPQAFADRVSGLFQAVWPHLEVTPDRFIRTTDADHKASVQAILQKVYDAGDIYFASYTGQYCVGCERFYTEKELVDGKCPDHGTEPVEISEENYFFRMSKYQAALKEHIESHPDFIRPERYKNEVLSMLGEPLDDLCISRPKTRLTWGIELPFDANYVTYVWFDALINYLTGLGWPDSPEYLAFWVEGDHQHLIAKDILKPHAIFWPTMLMSLGAPLYNHLNVHGYWNVDQAKMSKSLGNVVRPLELAEVYGVDAFRYFLLREMSFGLDASFSEQALVERYNADLANDLGNLFSRVLNMLLKYQDGVVPEVTAEGRAAAAEVLADLVEAARTVPGEYREHMTGFQFHKALMSVWHLIDQANKAVVRSAPWELAKDPDRAAELDAVMAALVGALAEITVLIRPVMPETAAAMGRDLSLGEDWPALAARLGELALVAPGTKLDKPQALFPRVDTAKVKAKAQKAQQKEAEQKDPAKPAKKKKGGKKAPPEPPAEIDIEAFGQVALKVGTVLEAGPVEGADRLLKLSVDLGEDAPRTIVAGIAQHYRPEEITGRQVVVVANLKPVTLKGVTSQGMVLAATGADGKLQVVSPAQQVDPGSRVR